ncbi:MAG: EthD domain-containing protein [Cyanobacteria bacterium J06639_18]
MIHQLIFAHPKPGMTEKDFQDYWKNIHATKYARKIPQIKRYAIDLRIPFGSESKDPLWSGVAEIWLPNEQEQLASLQSKEFLEGARLDEPKWAAFWRTLVLDTTAHVMLEGSPSQKDSKMVKLFILNKRKEGLPLEEFRQKMLDSYAPKILQLPGLKRYLQCHVRDSFYGIGEAVLDSVSILSFNDINALEAALQSREYKEQVEPNLAVLSKAKYTHTIVTDENWIIGPEFRN